MNDDALCRERQLDLHEVDTAGLGPRQLVVSTWPD